MAGTTAEPAALKGRQPRRALGQLGPGRRQRRAPERLAVILAVKGRDADPRRRLSRRAAPPVTCGISAERVGFEPTVPCGTHDFQAYGADTSGLVGRHTSLVGSSAVSIAVGRRRSESGGLVVNLVVRRARIIRAGGALACPGPCHRAALPVP